MSPTCIAAHHGDPPTPEPGLLLCLRCLSRLRRDLADIVLLFPLLDDLLTPSNRAGGHSSGKPGSRPPLNVDVADLLDQRGTVHAEITGWARIVIEDRQLAARPADAEQATRLLQVHLDWVAAQPWCDEAAAEIRDAAHRVRVACHDLERRWIIGTCTMPGPDALECGGPIQVEVQHTSHWDADTDDYDRRSSIRLVCRRCGDAWTEADLHGYMVVNDVWLPIDDAAYQLGVTRRTLNRHAAAGRIRRRRGMISWSDAQSVMIPGQDTSAG